MYTITPVAGEQLSRCSDFLLPAFSRLCTRPELWPRFIGAEASATGIPVGLTLVELPEDGAGARLCSIGVASAHRRKGIASALLQAAEAEVTRRGCSRMHARLIRNHEGPEPEIQNLLKKNGWPELQARGILCETDYPTVSRAPWMAHRSISPDCEVFLWKDAWERERAELSERLQNRIWFPEVLSPFDHEERLEPATSLGLRHAGKIAGWCIFHRVNAHTTECMSLVVTPELQGRGEAIALLVRGIELHTRLQDHRKFVFDVGFDKRAMMTFLRRRMVPYLTSMRTVYKSIKLLGHHAGQAAAPNGP